MESIDNKERFLEIFRREVTRPGAEEFLGWLCGTDFFTAPASTKAVSCRRRWGRGLRWIIICIASPLCQLLVHTYAGTRWNMPQVRKRKVPLS